MHGWSLKRFKALTSFKALSRSFKTVFEPFEHKIETVARIPRITSYVRIYQSELEHDVDTGIETHVFRIMVMFYKQEKIC